MKTTTASSKQGVTPAQMREAERGLRLMLGPKFPRVWIAEHSREALGQAHVEYQEWLTRNPPARNPVGWLLTCAYRRAQNLRDAERRRPVTDSLETAFHAVDKSTPTPEQEAIERDRQKRLHQALSHLPDKEVKLLALVYFDDNSIREAGRKLGWQKSAADRHHNTAMEKLRALVGDDRSLFNPATLGLAAYLATRGGRFSLMLDALLTPAREVLAGGLEALSAGARHLSELARRLSPFSEAGTAAANSGVGRAAGACGAGVVALICVGAVSVVAPGLQSAPPRRPPLQSGQVKGPKRQAAVPTLTAASTELPTPEPVEQARPSKVQATQRPQAEQKQAQAARAPRATHKQVEEHFGLDSGSGSSESAPEAETEATPESSASSPSSTPAPSSKPADPSAHEFGL